MENPIIPENISGKENDLSYSVSCNSIEDATELFKIAKLNLLNPDCWHRISGSLTAEFMLFDKNEKNTNKSATQNDFIRIDIPGPGLKSGEGFDWVKIVSVLEESNTEKEFIAMKVRPCSNPLSDDNTIAHFFAESSSSTFLIKREKNILTAEYHGRNEVPNTDTKNTLDNIRNAVVAKGAYIGLSELQWTALIKGFVTKSETNEN